MKVIHERWPDKEEVSVSAAVESVLCASAYEYGGEIETLRGELTKAQELIGRLVSVLVESRTIDAPQLQTVLGNWSDFKVQS